MASDHDNMNGSHMNGNGIGNIGNIGDTSLPLPSLTSLLQQPLSPLSPPLPMVDGSIGPLPTLTPSMMAALSIGVIPPSVSHVGSLVPPPPPPPSSSPLSPLLTPPGVPLSPSPSSTSSVATLAVTIPPSSHQPVTIPAANAPLRQREHYKSIIECGLPNPDKPGRRIVGHLEPFFGEVVEIFRAHSDPHGRILYRASAVAKVVGCTTSALAMYLARRRHTNDGIFQATAFKGKPRGRSGLKAGTYFLALEVCKEIEAHLRKDRRPPVIATSSLPTSNGLHSSTHNGSGNNSPGGSKRLRDGSPRPASPSPGSPTLTPLSRGAERAVERLSALDSPSASPASLARRLLLKSSSSRTASPLGRSSTTSSTLNTSSSSSSRPASPHGGIDDGEQSPPQSPTTMLSKLSIGGGTSGRRRKKSRAASSSSTYSEDDDVSSSDGDASSGWESGSDVDTGIQTSIPPRLKSAPGRSSRAASTATVAAGSSGRSWMETRRHHDDWAGSTDDLSSSRTGIPSSPPLGMEQTQDGVDGVSDVPLSSSLSMKSSSSSSSSAIPAHVTKAWVYDNSTTSGTAAAAASLAATSSYAPVLATLAPSLTPPALTDPAALLAAANSSTSPFTESYLALLRANADNNNNGAHGNGIGNGAGAMGMSIFPPRLESLNGSALDPYMNLRSPVSSASPSSSSPVSPSSISPPPSLPPVAPLSMTSSGGSSSPSPLSNSSPHGQLPASALQQFAASSYAQANAAIANASSLPPALQAQLLQRLAIENQQLMASLAQAEGGPAALLALQRANHAAALYQQQQLYGRGHNGSSSSGSSVDGVDAAPSPSHPFGSIGASAADAVGTLNAYDPNILAQIAAAAANLGLPFIPATPSIPPTSSLGGTGFTSPLSALSNTGFASPLGSSSGSSAPSVLSPGASVALTTPSASAATTGGITGVDHMFSPRSILGAAAATALLPNVDLSTMGTLLSPVGGVTGDMTSFIHSNPSSPSLPLPTGSINAVNHSPNGHGHTGGNSHDDRMVLSPSLNGSALLAGSSNNSVNDDTNHNGNGNDNGANGHTSSPTPMDHAAIDYLLPTSHHTHTGANDAPL